MGVDAAAQVAQWLHVLPRLPVSDMDRSLAYYQDALGLRLAWRTVDGGLAALSSGGVEILLLVPWTHEGPVPAQSAYIYVADPDAMCAACREAGGDVVEPVASRPTACGTSSCATPTATASRSGAARSGCVRWPTTTA